MAQGLMAGGDPLLSGPFAAPLWEAGDEVQQTSFTANSTPTPTEGYTTPHSNSSLAKPPGMKHGTISPTMMLPNMGRSSPQQVGQVNAAQQMHMYRNSATPVVVAQLREEFSGVVTPNGQPQLHQPGGSSPPMWQQQYPVTTQSPPPPQPQYTPAPQLPMQPVYQTTAIHPAPMQQQQQPYQAYPILQPQMQQQMQQHVQMQQQHQHQQQQQQQQPVGTCKVVLLKNVPWTVNLIKLQGLLEEFLAKQQSVVTKLLPVWDTGMVFAEVSRPVDLAANKLQLGDGWVDLEVARNEKVNVAAESCILQARYIALTPGRDVPVGESRAKQSAQAFANMQNARLTPSGALVLASQLGRSWVSAIVPPASVRSTKQTIQHLRRKYAQILVRYNSIEEARNAKTACDGRLVTACGVTFVIRLEYAKQSNSTPSGRVTVTPAELDTTPPPTALDAMFRPDDTPQQIPQQQGRKGGGRFPPAR